MLAMLDVLKTETFPAEKVDVFEALVQPGRTTLTGGCPLGAASSFEPVRRHAWA